MAKAYTKEFLISAFLSRYESLGEETIDRMFDMANKFYDKVGKDKFRVYASLDADALKEYKATL